MGLGAATLVGAAVAVVLVGHLTGRGGRSMNATPTAQAQRGSSWVAEANAVCRLGRKLYPNIALGAGNGDPDTMNYAVNRLVGEIGSISVPIASARHAQLERHGLAAASAWQSLATRPIS